MSIKSIFIILVSRVVFDFLLIQLGRINPKVLSAFHKIPEKWKGKWQVKWIAIFILIFICAIFVVGFGISDIIGTILVGFFISLCELAFKKPQEVK